MSTRVPFSVTRVRLIAGNTVVEATRQRLFLFLLVVAVGLVASGQFFREFNFGSSELKFIADFGFGAIVAFGSILTIAATAQLFFSEIENRTALTLLAKPVGRGEFIFGKLLGVAIVLGAFCLVTTGLVAALLVARESELRVLHPEQFEVGGGMRVGDVLWVGALQWLKFVVLAAVTLLIGSFSNTNLFTVVMGFFVLVICHLQYLAQEFYATGAGVGAWMAGLLGWVFPNFQLFNLADLLDEGALPLGLVVRVAVYGLVYAAVFGGLAVYSFRHREI